MDNPLIYLLVLVAGLIIGSFLNVLIYRLPSVVIAGIQPGATRSVFYLAWPLSFCPRCSEPIKPWNNIPVLSYLLLKGRSACCGKHISIRYPLVELIAALLALLCLYKFGFGVRFALACVFCWALLVVSWIDAKRFILPDILVQPLLWLGLVANLFGVFVPLHHAVFATVAGYLALFVISEGSSILMRKRMLGAGDPKLLAALGAWLGWELLAFAFVVGSVTASIYGLAHMALKGRFRRYAFVAFGPHLAIGGAAALLVGPQLLGYWLR